MFSRTHLSAHRATVLDANDFFCPYSLRQALRYISTKISVRLSIYSLPHFTRGALHIVGVRAPTDLICAPTPSLISPTSLVYLPEVGLFFFIWNTKICFFPYNIFCENSFSFIRHSQSRRESCDSVLFSSFFFFFGWEEKKKVFFLSSNFSFGVPHKEEEK